MAKVTSNFVCQQCGYISPSFLGKCPNCDSWNSFVETVVAPVGKATPRLQQTINDASVITLSDIRTEQFERIKTGIFELDRVLGGGIVPGMAVLLTGEPGIGKSTLLLEILKSVSSASGKDILYVAGEESASQIRLRAERLNVVTKKALVLEQTDVDIISNYISNKGNTLGLVIVDSIQTLTTTDLVGSAGSVGQVRECAARLIALCKSLSLPLFLVGHVTREGTIAGPKVLEHIVDTILSVEGDRYEGLRIIRTSKNRFGPTDEVGIFSMTDKGLEEMRDYRGFGTESAQPNPGSCLTIIMEGTRPMLVEIQALVTSTPLPSPRRVASGVDHNRMLTIIAILQKRMNVPLYKEDVYVSVSGGLKVLEPAADLAIALAILTSYHNKSLAPKTVAFGELDLLGNLRKVNSLPKRIKEAKALDFKNVLSPETLKALPGFKL